MFIFLILSLVTRKFIEIEKKKSFKKGAISAQNLYKVTGDLVLIIFFYATLENAIQPL